MSTALRRNMKRIKVLLAKSDLDGHDKGVRYIAEVLRNEGMEVILIRYRIPEEVPKVALEEDVDVVGLSFYGPGIMHDTSVVLNKLKEEHGTDILVILGGIIPDEYKPYLTNTKVVLKKHVLIGAHSVVLPGVTIGEGVSMGAFSLVKESLDPWWVYFGIPVKKFKKRSKEMLNLERNFITNGYHPKN